MSENPTAIGQRSAPTAGQTRVVRTEELPWQELGPGIRCKVLYRDEAAGSATVLFHFAPGAQAPPHEHMGLEQTYIIAGSLSDHGQASLDTTALIAVDPWRMHALNVVLTHRHPRRH
jgi:anti-sigma factor ChrR (cupin superfamily)